MDRRSVGVVWIHFCPTRDGIFPASDNAVIPGTPHCVDDMIGFAKHAGGSVFDERSDRFLGQARLQVEEQFRTVVKHYVVGAHRPFARPTFKSRVRADVFQRLIDAPGMVASNVGPFVEQ